MKRILVRILAILTAITIVLPCTAMAEGGSRVSISISDIIVNSDNKYYDEDDNTIDLTGLVLKYIENYSEADDILNQHIGINIGGVSSRLDLQFDADIIKLKIANMLFSATQDEWKEFIANEYFYGDANGYTDFTLTPIGLNWLKKRNTVAQQAYDEISALIGDGIKSLVGEQLAVVSPTPAKLKYNGIVLDGEAYSISVKSRDIYNAIQLPLSKALRTGALLDIAGMLSSPGVTSLTNITDTGEPLIREYDRLSTNIKYIQLSDSIDAIITRADAGADKFIVNAEIARTHIDYYGLLHGNGRKIYGLTEEEMNEDDELDISVSINAVYNQSDGNEAELTTANVVMSLYDTDAEECYAIISMRGKYNDGVLISMHVASEPTEVLKSMIDDMDESYEVAGLEFDYSRDSGDDGDTVTMSITEHDIDGADVMSMMVSSCFGEASGVFSFALDQSMECSLRYEEDGDGAYNATLMFDDEYIRDEISCKVDIKKGDFDPDVIISDTDDALNPLTMTDQESQKAMLSIYGEVMKLAGAAMQIPDLMDMINGFLYGGYYDYYDDDFGSDLGGSIAA